MAISAPATLTSGGSAAASSYTTASVSPGANRLLLLTVACYVAAGSTQPTAPTVAGNGLTWVQVGTNVIVDAAGADRGTLFLFRAMGASPSAGTIVITPSASMKGTWVLDEISGTDTSGTNGSGAIVQSVKTDDTGSVATKSVTLAAFGSTGNAGYGLLGKQNTTAVTWNNSWTKKGEVTGITFTYSGTGYFLGSTQLVMNCTWTTASRAGCMAVEIKAAGGVTSLEVSAASHAHVAEAVVLTQTHALAVSNGAHAHAAANVVLDEGEAAINLGVSDSSHTHVADDAVLTQAHELAATNATHGHASETPTLTQAHLLAAQGTSHAHAADSLLLTQVHGLTTQASGHAHTADGISLTQTHELGIANASHGHEAENVTFSAAGVLDLADAQHGHTADSADLTQVHLLTVDASTLAHTAEQLALTQLHQLAIQGGTHDHSADEVETTEQSDVAVQDAAHGHTAESLVLANDVYVLVVQSGAHGHNSDGFSLDQLHLLVVASAIHGHVAGLTPGEPVDGPTTIMIGAHRGQVRDIPASAEAQFVSAGVGISIANTGSSALIDDHRVDVEIP